jgi:hypothetical protein
MWRQEASAAYGKIGVEPADQRSEFCSPMYRHHAVLSIVNQVHGWPGFAHQHQRRKLGEDALKLCSGLRHAMDLMSVLDAHASAP